MDSKRSPHFRLLLSIAAVLVLAASSGLKANETVTDWHTAFATYLETVSSSSGSSALGYSLFRRNEEILNYFQGSLNGTDFAAYSSFRLGEIGAPLTVLWLQMLDYRDSLDLHRPFALENAFGSTPHERTLTLHHLLTHTGGLAGHSDQLLPEMPQPEDVLSLLRRAPYAAAPGQLHIPLRSNISAAAYIALRQRYQRQALSLADAWQSAFTTDLIEPLGLSDTAVRLDHAGAHLPLETLVSSVHDLRLWLQIELGDGFSPQGHRVISREQALLRREQLRLPQTMRPYSLVWRRAAHVQTEYFIYASESEDGSLLCGIEPSSGYGWVVAVFPAGADSRDLAEEVSLSTVELIRQLRIEGN